MGYHYQKILIWLLETGAKNMHVATIVGTRPEIIKMSEIMLALDRHYRQTIIHTGQNYDYELNEVFFKDLEVRSPDHYLGVSGNDLGETIGNIISRSFKILSELQPDAVLVYGDTNSCLSVIAAKRLKIPVFHLEAGNRSFDENVPEELNRRIVDHISDINFTLTEHARNYLLNEGIRGERIIKSGGFMTEVIDKHLTKIENSDVLDRMRLVKEKFFIASLHREENVDDLAKLTSLMDSFQEICEYFKMPIVFSCHPRTRKRLEEFRLKIPKNVKLIKPLGLFDYLALQRDAACVISDSGTITEEADILGFPAISPRLSHERPEGFDEGVIMLTNMRPERLISAIRLQMSDYSNKSKAPCISDYRKTQPSMTVVKAIGSYIDYVNKNVWGV